MTTQQLNLRRFPVNVVVSKNLEETATRTKDAGNAEIQNAMFEINQKTSAKSVTKPVHIELMMEIRQNLKLVCVFRTSGE
jgi:hypothetical protein